MTSLWKDCLKTKRKLCTICIKNYSHTPTLNKQATGGMRSLSLCLNYSTEKENYPYVSYFFTFKALLTKKGELKSWKVIRQTLNSDFLLPLEPEGRHLGPIMALWWKSHFRGSVLCLINFFNMSKHIFLSCPQTDHEKEVVYTCSLVVISISHTIGRVLAALLWVNSWFMYSKPVSKGKNCFFKTNGVRWV